MPPPAPRPQVAAAVRWMGAERAVERASGRWSPPSTTEQHTPPRRRAASSPLPYAPHTPPPTQRAFLPLLFKNSSASPDSDSHASSRSPSDGGSPPPSSAGGVIPPPLGSPIDDEQRRLRRQHAVWLRAQRERRERRMQMEFVCAMTAVGVVNLLVMSFEARWISHSLGAVQMGAYSIAHGAKSYLQNLSDVSI